MDINTLRLLIEKIKLKILILQIQLRIKLLQEKLTVPNLPGPRYTMVHHDGGGWRFWQVNEHHRKKWQFKSSLGHFCGYHKFIEYSGKLFVARRDNEEGAHVVQPGNPHFWNRNSVGICLQGNMENMQPTEAQLQTLKGELDGYGLPVKMHYEILPTQCPGRNLIAWVKNYRGN